MSDSELGHEYTECRLTMSFVGSQATLFESQAYMEYSFYLNGGFRGQSPLQRGCAIARPRPRPVLPSTRVTYGGAGLSIIQFPYSCLPNFSLHNHDVRTRRPLTFQLLPTVSVYLSTADLSTAAPSFTVYLSIADLSTATHRFTVYLSTADLQNTGNYFSVYLPTVDL